jgi:hypothetical protein
MNFPDRRPFNNQIRSNKSTIQNVLVDFIVSLDAATQFRRQYISLNNFQIIKTDEQHAFQWYPNQPLGTCK